MNAEEFRKAGKEMVDYVADYLENIRERRVLPTVQPGYLRQLIPAQAPEEPDSWQQVLQDVERVIMPGVTHWNSPQFHAYFPTGNSYPAIVADMLSDAIGCIGFTWIASPACTELEVAMMDWLGQALRLPAAFLASAGHGGGGVIQGTASEASVVGLLSARARATRRLKQKHPDWLESAVVGQLVAYCSDQAHSSAERAGLLAGVRMRQLQTDNNFSLRGAALRRAIEKDKSMGLVPFFLLATLGTTPSCAFDCLPELGAVCEAEGLWMHVDAAYAGSAFICPEFRPLLDGVGLADSFNFNPHKWMLVNFDCSAMWVKRANDLVDAFNVDPLYLKHDKQGLVPDYRHWQIPLGRRFRSLKLWFVLRMFGLSGLRAHIRRHVALAKLFGELVGADRRFEVVTPVTLGLVCFRLKAKNEVNEALLKQINDAGRIHMVPSKLRQTYILRFAVCASATEESDIELAWGEVRDQATRLVGPPDRL
ncbi:aromatic-L-amino-acid decarboxylase-like [Pollicipes pollicipes]|uniref:aromatic-L-amino-acid decarboxylase-like n=1 Tax=Pollicipes pollicipes TaxID=41117 RepID=UPI001884A7AA|nr:aromatic-L-amino-acid decarboxylase-like [Pollicipes pollicipes]